MNGFEFKDGCAIFNGQNHSTQRLYKNTDKAFFDENVKALKDAGYVVLLNDTAFLPDGVEATLMAYKDGEYLLVSYYEDTEALNEDWKDAQEEAKELEEEYEDIVCKKSGKMIFVGTKQAVKDAK
jgi:hypothetical protein